MRLEIKKLKRIKESTTILTEDLTNFINTASHPEFARRKTTLKNVLMRIEKLSETLYEEYDYSQPSQEITTDLEYVESVIVMMANLETAASQVMPKKEQHVVFNLSKSTLPTFEGNPINWASFWDILNRSVIDNKDFTNIQKLTYIKVQVTGESQKLSQGFKLESSRNLPAIDLLKLTYG